MEKFFATNTNEQGTLNDHIYCFNRAISVINIQMNCCKSYRLLQTTVHGGMKGQYTYTVTHAKDPITEIKK
jgi:hypothetical protein